MRQKMAFYLEDIETTVGRTINLVILGLILLSSAIFVIETYPISDDIIPIFKAIDLGIMIIFTLEYCLRLWCAEDRLKFLFSFFSLIDLMAIIPLFLGIVDTRFLRILRWFRILRLIRLWSFEVAIFQISTADGVIFARIFLTLYSIVFIYSGLIYLVEHEANQAGLENFFDALYFSIVTMTTVGFGDITPLSKGGRILTLLMIITGVTTIPWQVGDLVKQLVKTANRVTIVCTKCGLSLHEEDANYCKICGTKLM